MALFESTGCMCSPNTFLPDGQTTHLHLANGLSTLGTCVWGLFIRIVYKWFMV